MMNNIKFKFLATALIFSTCAAQESEYLYFPELGIRAQLGEQAALIEVLELAEVTSPGEQLEELAEISSKFVRINPEAFLHAQSNFKSCFGVDFMGADYIDNLQAKLNEIELRKNALLSVDNKNLVSAQKRCLEILNDHQ